MYLNQESDVSKKLLISKLISNLKLIVTLRIINPRERKWKVYMIFFGPRVVKGLRWINLQQGIVNEGRRIPKEYDSLLNEACEGRMKKLVMYCKYCDGDVNTNVMSRNESSLQLD